ncbi:potassium channel family protein [Marinitenerispora sediminis]|uniref:Trk system potassium uptake protein TrkA n=1 Tax=Marinitenerispora sediminis TaxID=1931232 RepID=A0A368SY24_9ACTN|nr:TrkA family potassium uptake protein [Marinitenerispora sediminis]RCV48619.1 potassium transporter TrkA [Marinitenerispora sediminis]RCV52376.1 potassium transporter TrkA [Marinitenerispora sediminis]RCV58649.1 potassium transporter TrkA [Marinitenerispora sediminis]
MHIVILGCGRVGSTLAHTVQDMGHSVAVIDRDPGAFRRLRSSAAKSAVTGVGHDRDALVRAGIENAAAFAAVSSGDNSNIIAARVARETFGVRHVVARIYDPRRAEVYQRLGIATVGTVRWTADTILRRLLPEASGADAPLWRDPSGTLVLTEVPLTEAWVGAPVQRLETALQLRVAYLDRSGEIVLPRGDEPLRSGDVVHVLLRADARDRVLERLRPGPAAGPEGRSV